MVVAQLAERSHTTREPWFESLQTLTERLFTATPDVLCSNPLMHANEIYVFNACVRNCMLSTDTSNSNLMFGTFSDMCPRVYEILDLNWLTKKCCIVGLSLLISVEVFDELPK